MKRAILLASCVALLAGCSSAPVGPSFQSARSSELVAANFDAADQLLVLAQRPLDNQSTLIVTTLANLDDLNQTSSLGRLISEHLATRLTQRGLNVAELRLTSKVYVRASTGGEMMLSRDVREIAANYSAQAVVVGTYSLASDYVYINLKLIESGQNRVIAAHSYLLPYGGQIRALAPTKAGAI